MKIYAISDLHLSGENVKKNMDIYGGYVKGYIEEVKKNWDAAVEDDDIVLISGDISWAKNLKDAQPDLDFIGKFKGKKIIIRGHDYWWSGISAVSTVLHKNTRALQHDFIREEGVLICGSRGCEVPEPLKKNSSRKNKQFFKEIRLFNASLEYTANNRQADDVFIVMMHYPPFNSKLEDSDFTYLLNKYKVNKVVYGHLHGQHIQTPLYYVKDDIEYYLTSCDKLNNKLVRIL
jgi:uncharacterized protein